MNGNLITTTILEEHLERQNSNHSDCSIPYSMPNIVNNTFHSNFDASLLPFTFTPPPSRFYSMLHHDSEENHHLSNEDHHVPTPSTPISNCSSPTTCSNNLQQPTTCIAGSTCCNVFIPNQQSSSPLCNSSATSDSSTTTIPRSISKDYLPTTRQHVKKNQVFLDAPASALLLEPPSLSTIIDDHHPTIPTADYHLKKRQKEQFGPNNNPSLIATSAMHALEFKKKSFSSEAEEISVENCEEVCLACGCEEDRIEAELRLQDTLERKSNKRRMDGDDEDEQMSDAESPLLPDINSTKKRKTLTQLENLEALESVLHQLEPDCVLSIFQFLNFSGKDYWFCDARNMYGRFKYNNQVLPLFKYVTIEQHSPLTLDESHHGSINCNIQSLTIERITNQPLECENGYLKKVGGSLKTFIYYNRGLSSDNALSMGSELIKKSNYSDVMGYLSSEDEKDLSSFELIEDEYSHVIGLKRRARSEGSCFLKEVYRNCRVLEKLKIVDTKGYVPFKVSMRPGTNRPVDCLAFTNTLTKIRLFNCLLPNHSLQAISKMVHLKSLHFEKIFVSDPNQYDVLLKLRNLKVLKIQVAELPATVLRNLSTSFPKLTKLYINILSNGTFEENLRVDQLRELRYLALVSHFKLDLLSIMRNCLKLEHLHLGFDVCFNHVFPNERLTSCILRNVFISPDRSKVLIQNDTLVNLKLSPASIKAAQKELSFIKQQRQLMGKPTLSITEFSSQ